MTRFFLLFAIALSLGVGLAAVRKHETVQACGAAGPFDFDTLELENYIQGYTTAIELAVAGKAIASTYPVGTELIDVRYQGLKAGPRANRLNENTNLRTPPSVYKSMIWVESTWFNGAGTVPFGGVGPVLRSFDCGYGLGQVTTGMTNSSGIASAKQAAIGTHYLVNLAEGVRIFADKWNSAPRFRPIAGSGNPAVIEDWYYAIWSYNGFAYSNHPMNPIRDPLRGGGQSPIFHCGDGTAPSHQGGKFGYGDYTYPERVYGCMVYPPKTRLPGTTIDVLVYPKQPVNMPDFSIEEVAEAFDTQHFLECQGAGFSGGCPGMDFPTAFPEKQIVPHADNTPLVDATRASQILASPLLAYTGPTSAHFVVAENGTANTARVTVANVGTGIGSFRIRSTQPWLTVRHPGEAASRTMDGGVAIGDEIEVVTQSPRVDRPRLAQQGYDSVLDITVDASLMPAGTSSATLFIEPLLAPGASFVLPVTAFRPNVITIPTATPTAVTPTATLPVPPTSTPIPTPTPDPYPFKAVAPQFGKD